MDILVGCDPELFVRKDGSLVSGYGLIPGTKRQPHPVKDGAVQVDGMALEFNTKPAATQEQFLNNIKSVMQELAGMIPGYELVPESVANFGLEYIKKQPREATELGCDPDYNAYIMDANPKPDGEVPFRTASGHVHIGWTEGEEAHENAHFTRCGMVAKQMDILLGVPSILFDADGAARRELYGKAGCFRPKSYGVEYRTLSNKWLKNDALQRFVYNQIIRGMELIQKGVCLFDTIPDAEECINTSNRNRASQIILQTDQDRELKYVLEQSGC